MKFQNSNMLTTKTLEADWINHKYIKTQQSIIWFPFGSQTVVFFFFFKSHIHISLAKQKVSFWQAKIRNTPMLLLSPAQTLRHSALSKVSTTKMWVKQRIQHSQDSRKTAVQIYIWSSSCMLSNQHWNSAYEQLYHLAAAINKRIQENGTKLITFQRENSSMSHLLP